MCVCVPVCGGSEEVITSPGQSRAGEPGINSASCMSDLRKQRLCVCVCARLCPPAGCCQKRGGANKRTSERQLEKGVSVVERKRVSICCFHYSWAAPDTRTSFLHTYTHYTSHLHPGSDSLTCHSRISFQPHSFFHTHSSTLFYFLSIHKQHKRLTHTETLIVRTLSPPVCCSMWVQLSRS